MTRRINHFCASLLAVLLVGSSYHLLYTTNISLYFSAEDGDPTAPRSSFDLVTHFLTPHTGKEVRMAMVEGSWAVYDLPENIWNRNYTCRSGIRCSAMEIGADESERLSEADVILTLNPEPWWNESIANRAKTHLAFLGMEGWDYDIDMDTVFDYKATVYGAKDDRHVWATMSETPWAEMLTPRAQLDWSKKSKDRNVMFMSSNSCPSHRSWFVEQLIEHGVDVWSLGTCASSHETTDRVQKLKQLCGDEAGWGAGDWRGPKNCLTEHFKFIISIEKQFEDDYISEKFFHPFAVGTVPLYWGGLNVAHYNPGENSFVNVRDFGGDEPDIAAIAALLKRLNENDAQYEEYFRWKQQKALRPEFGVVNYHSWKNLPCVMCEKRLGVDLGHLGSVL